MNSPWRKWGLPRRGPLGVLRRAPGRHREARQRPRGLASVSSAALAAALLLAASPPASADTAPVDPADPATPVTVSADALPTVQIDGVVWQQTIIGDTVYAVGKFDTARPAGAAAGTQTTGRKNILAYSLSTGQLVDGFQASLNAQALAVAASPDGSRLYVGGDFTEANGQPASKVVALNPQTGATVAGWAPKMSSTVRAIVATSGTVYLGGLFSTVGSTSRSKLAAVLASNGTLLPWKPIAAGGRVNALVLAPDGSKLVAGGLFTTLNGTNKPGFGLGAVDSLTGANIATPVNDVVRNAGTGSGITSLSSDGTNWYGTGFIDSKMNGTGTLEGSFAGNWSDLAVKWIDDCHGDSYSVFASNTAVYKAGHSHYCGNLLGFPETTPRTWHRGLAYSREATGTLTKDIHGYPSFTGKPAPSLLVWYPDLDTGTATGQSQGPWSVTGNNSYVVMGGEFRNVNFKGQQGLVRFAVSALAPNKEGARSSSASTNPALTSPAAGVITVKWQSNWDRDNAALSYRLSRDGKLISTQSLSTTFWNRPMMGFTDTVAPGTTHSYRVVVTDPFGNSKYSTTVSLRAQ